MNIKNIFKYSIIIIIPLVVVMMEFMSPMTATKKVEEISNVYVGTVSIYDANKGTLKTEDITIDLNGKLFEKKLTIISKLMNLGKKNPMVATDIFSGTIKLGEDIHEIVLWKDKSNQYIEDISLYKKEGYEDMFHVAVSEDFKSIKIEGSLTENTAVVSSIEIAAVKDIKS